MTDQVNWGRRRLLRGGLMGGAAWCSGLEKVLGRERCWPLGQKNFPPGSERFGLVEFSGEQRVPMGEAMGAELDGRLYTDLTNVDSGRSLTAREQFYIRTRVSKLLPDQGHWVVRASGRVAKPLEFPIEQLRGMAKPIGRHLLECAGNARSVHFGMISVADWDGVQISELVARMKPGPSVARICVSGFDSYSSESATSIPGASWSFTMDELKQTGAFLATGMNGSGLTEDHGAPIRLVVPGWYGCTCIKWVNEITFTGGDVAATSQMKEYAGRTMQSGVPALAREFRPAVIEHAAMPVRIEKWKVQDHIEYAVVGILWGGAKEVRRLQIRFNPEEEYVDVDELGAGGVEAWRVWRHVWRPKQSGSYLIRLRIAEPEVVARRLDSGYYMRSVEIGEV